MKSFWVICKYITCLILIWVIISFVVATGWHPFFKPESLDHLGSFLGGFFTFIGIYFLYKTLISQEKAITKQKEEFLIQSFESKLIERIKFNREIVDNLSYRIPYLVEESYMAKNRVFELYFEQIYEAIKIVKDKLSEISIEEIYSTEDNLEKDRAIWKDSIKERTIINIAYLIVFLGVNKSGYHLLKDQYLKKYSTTVILPLLNLFSIKPAKWDLRYSEFYLTPPANPTKKAEIKEQSNKYYAGFHNELGHYFRTLFHISKYVNSQSMLNYNSKYDYMKMLRGLFSNYEEAVLFCNSISDFGVQWEAPPNSTSDINNSFITKYNLIKNLSPDFIDVVNIRQFYPNVIYEGFDFISHERLELEKLYT